MKKLLTLALAVVLVVACVASCFTMNATAAERVADLSKGEIAIHVANTVAWEGVVGIQTEGNFNSAWRNAILLEEDNGVYTVIAKCGASGSGPNWDIAENQIVVEANCGNDWPALTSGGTGWWTGGEDGHGTPYEECPNFATNYSNANFNAVAAVEVGAQFTLEGFDGEAYPVIPVDCVDGVYAYACEEQGSYTYLKPYDSNAKPEKTVTLVADDNLSTPNKGLDLLVDGVYADGATTFGDDRLTGINWEKLFKYDGSDNGTYEISLIVDLGQLENIDGVKIGGYKEGNSFVNLPDSVKIYLSNDGENFIRQADGKWTSSVEGLIEDTTRTLKGDCLYFADWNTRCSIIARYIKVVFTLSDPWIFLSEIEAVTNNNPTRPQAVDQIEYAGIDVGTINESAVVVTPAVGALDLNEGVQGDYRLVRSGVITIAKWNPEKAAWVVTFNQANPWPNTRSGSVELAEDEILISSVSSGTSSYEGAGTKWVMWHLEVGDELHIYDDVITIGKTLEGENEYVREIAQPQDPELLAKVAGKYVFKNVVFPEGYPLSEKDKQIITAQIMSTMGEVCAELFADGTAKFSALGVTAVGTFTATETSVTITIEGEPQEFIFDGSNLALIVSDPTSGMNFSIILARDNTTPSTGDTGLIALAVVSVIAAAGIVVCKKRK